jgi:hypothetical protein
MVISTNYKASYCVHFLQPPDSSCFLGPNIIFSTLVSNIPNPLGFILRVRDQVSQQYKTTGHHLPIKAWTNDPFRAKLVGLSMFSVADKHLIFCQVLKINEV